MARNTNYSRTRIQKKARAKAKKAEEHHGRLEKTPDFKMAFVADNFDGIQKFISLSRSASRHDDRLSRSDYKWMMEFQEFLIEAGMPTSEKTLQKLKSTYTRNARAGFRPRYAEFRTAEVAILPPVDASSELEFEPIVDEDEELEREKDCFNADEKVEIALELYQSAYARAL